MSTTTNKPRPTLAELTTEQPESTDPGYLAWKEARIRKAQAEARRNPDKLTTHAEMRARLGLDR